MSRPPAATTLATCMDSTVTMDHSKDRSGYAIVRKYKVDPGLQLLWLWLLLLLNLNVMTTL